MAIHIPGSKKDLGGDDVFIIAEIGKNFIQTEEEKSVGECLKNAKDLVDAAVDAGVDAVKFQTHEIEDEQLNIKVVSPHFKGSDRYSWILRNMRSTPYESFWKPMKAYCDEKGIIFFSTPMSRKAAMKLNDLDVSLWKVGSGDIQDYVALDYMIETGKPIIISSGMVSLRELDEVVQYITERGAPLAVLYCVSIYPCPHDHFNLATIEHLKEKYPEVVTGFSDHSVGGHGVDLAAVALGAQIIEKHLSFSRDFWGADHRASITPEEMKAMVLDIRNGNFRDVNPSKYYGSRERELEGANNQFRPYFNKSLMAGCDISEGTVLTKEMVYAMRPKLYAKGLPSDQFENVVGRRVGKTLKKYDPITEDILQN